MKITYNQLEKQCKGISLSFREGRSRCILFLDGAFGARIVFFYSGESLLKTLEPD